MDWSRVGLAALALLAASAEAQTEDKPKYQWLVGKSACLVEASAVFGFSDSAVGVRAGQAYGWKDAPRSFFLTAKICSDSDMVLQYGKISHCPKNTAERDGESLNFTIVLTQSGGILTGTSVFNTFSPYVDGTVFQDRAGSTLYIGDTGEFRLSTGAIASTSQDYEWFTMTGQCTIMIE